MSEDNNLNEVHPELEEILTTAEDKLVDHVIDSVLEDFKQIEQAMWDKIGDPDGLAALFGVHILANNMADAMDKVVELGEDAMPLNKPDDIDSDEGGLLGIECYGETGHAYDMLPSPEMLLAIAEKDPVGIIVRVGGHSSQTAVKDGKRPSQADDRQDVVLTVMCTHAAVYTIVRFVSDPSRTEIVVQQLAELNVGESKLVDAIVTTFMGPNIIRDQRPEMFEDFKEELRGQINKHNN